MLLVPLFLPPSGHAEPAAARIELLPTPKQVRWGDGPPVLVARPGEGAAVACIVAGPEAGYAAEVLAARLNLQLLQVEDGRVCVPLVEITDWPDVRYRCASDWLLNVEANRWCYDWGDGRKNYQARIERMLDFCFQYKINMVWFDGFGWNVERTPGYADLMRNCTRAARRRGIRLVFAGYGGGYGTSYQKRGSLP